ncbi:MAG: UvrD-helicase domain-containing protein [Roseivirga sp.]
MTQCPIIDYIGHSTELLMPYIADLHVHSHYSRATSKDLHLESLYQWAQIKGIDVVGTGDFTHPQWFQELQTKLVPDGSGFFRLKEPPRTPAFPGLKSQARDVRFCLTTEISSIYKHGDKVRKNHNLLFAPDLETVAKINARLATIGNLKADGRPILGLPSRDLLEIVLEASDRAYLIPAHIWTPWFSTLGSKAGYDSIEACFRDLTPHIFALETGLSSDPAMNWKLSALDRYTLISNSDAHSPQKLGREANRLDTALTYDAMFEAFQTGQGFLGTLEFFPEEGKYHLDGHRKCGVCLEPAATQVHQGLCPTCGQPLTVGVLHRVEELADRAQPQQPSGAANFEYLIPLPEMVAEIKGTGPNSKGVQQQFQQIIGRFGNEFAFLREAPLEDIHKHLGPVYAEAIRRLRQEQVSPTPGYDGLYGIIHVFQPGEVQQLSGQLLFFEAPSPTVQRRNTAVQPLTTVKKPIAPLAPTPPKTLNAAQQAVKERIRGVTLVKAGPGTGKTQTLIHWIAHCLAQPNTAPTQLLAITFTNKAAEELKARLTALLGEQAQAVHTGTFHAVAYQLLQMRYPALQTVYDDEDRQWALAFLFPALKPTRRQQLARALVRYFETGHGADFEGLSSYVERYEAHLQHHQAVDLAAILQQLLQLWKQEPDWLAQHRARYACLAVDELQDINPLQYQFIQALGQEKNILAIGDPDQAIYGFRGADVQLFFQFQQDFAATTLVLEEHYRSTGTIVQAAQALIQHNTVRSGLQLQAKKPQGAQLSVFEADNEREEAMYVTKQIKTHVGGVDNLALGLHDTGTHTFDDIAVLFRQRAVGQSLFAQLRKAGIPAHFSDGTSFLAHPPFCIVADILRLLVQPADLAALHGFLLHGLRWKQAAIRALLTTTAPGAWTTYVPSSLPAADQAAYQAWVEWYASLGALLPVQGVAGVVATIMERYLPSSALDNSQRLQKTTLLTLAQDASKDIAAFLRAMTLGPYTDAGRIRGEGVHLLTFHAAKGLEFPIVFIVGAEESITPMQRADSDLEEERRLFYVALTRAQAQVHLTWARHRKQYGQVNARQPSRFLAELPPACCAPAAKDPATAKRQAQERQLRLF